MTNRAEAHRQPRKEAKEKKEKSELEILVSAAMRRLTRAKGSKDWGKFTREVAKVFHALKAKGISMEYSDIYDYMQPKFEAMLKPDTTAEPGEPIDTSAVKIEDLELFTALGYQALISGNRAEMDKFADEMKKLGLYK